MKYFKVESSLIIDLLQFLQIQDFTVIITKIKNK